MSESFPAEFDTLFCNRAGELSANGAEQMRLCGKMLALSWFMGDYDHLPSGTTEADSLDGNRGGNAGNIMVCDKKLVFIDFAASYPTSGIQANGSMKWGSTKADVPPAPGTLNHDLPRLLANHANPLLQNAFSHAMETNTDFRKACLLAAENLPLNDMTLADALSVPPENPDDSDEEIAAEEANDARRACFQQTITAIYDVSHNAEKAAAAIASIRSDAKSPYLTKGIAFMVDQFGLDIKELNPTLVAQMGDVMRTGFMETAQQIKATPPDLFRTIADAHLRPLCDEAGKITRRDDQKEPLAQVLQLDMITLMQPLWSHITP